jgi:hypothetical protein
MNPFIIILVDVGQCYPGWCSVRCHDVACWDVWNYLYIYYYQSICIKKIKESKSREESVLDLSFLMSNKYYEVSSSVIQYHLHQP